MAAKARRMGGKAGIGTGAVASGAMAPILLIRHQ